MKRVLFLLICLPIASIALGQARYDYTHLCTEKLDRGVVAIQQDDGSVAVSWRILRDDRTDQAFNVYRNGVRINPRPLTIGGSFFIDENPPQEGDVVYEVKGGVTDGSYVLSADAPYGYIPVKIQNPGKGYSANDASVGDVDGDGQYELFLKWNPINSRDNSQPGYTNPTFIDCYRLNGEQLWRINLGNNIRSGAHYTQFIVADFDGDGKAEMMLKTGDGTIDGTGHALGDSLANWRNKQGHIIKGPEYITVFDGLTGEALDTKPYIPERGNVSDWGDNYGNRSERYLAAVGYLGNKKQDSDDQRNGLLSAIFCRGYYTRTVIAAWDWDGSELTNRWIFDTDDLPWSDYAGQGNHNLRVCDVDGDGLDEITYGSMAVDHDGTGLYNTGMGHGDAIHLVADPNTNRLYIWDCHENKRDGTDFRDACTGEVVFQVKSHNDVGRAMAADVDPTNYGVELWSTDTYGIRDITGRLIDVTPLSINFGIWWDGDLLRELLDHEQVTKYDWQNKTNVIIQQFDGVFNNGTKSNPCLSADILGDWREEVIVRNRESTELRIYVSTFPTEYRINCLMQDIPYRHSVATQNVGYNQPPEPGYYIGPDRKNYLK